MNAGRITAKLRDAVQIRFFEEGRELKRYKNIEMPDDLKELEIKDFMFDIDLEGKITFKLLFEKGILPEVFPANRPKITRAEKAAAKAAAQEVEKAEPETTTALMIVQPAPEAEPGTETEPAPEAEAEAPQIAEPEAETEAQSDSAEEAADMEINFNVTGKRRKKLVTAVQEIISAEPAYKGAPSFAFTIGNYIIDKNGTLTGKSNPELLGSLAEQGFIADGSAAV